MAYLNLSLILQLLLPELNLKPVLCCCHCLLLHLLLACRSQLQLLLQLRYLPLQQVSLRAHQQPEAVHTNDMFVVAREKQQLL
jgi:hypothetical protein